MRTIGFFLCLGLGAAWALEGGAWGPVERVLGRSGREVRGAFQVLYPRSDLNVTVQGIPLEPVLGPIHRFIFDPMGREDRLWGELVLLEREIPGALRSLAREGFDASPPRPFLIREAPRLRKVYIRKEGDRLALARALQRVMASRPLAEGMEKATPAPTFPAKPSASPTPWAGWAPLTGVLGPRTTEGNVLSYELPAGKEGPPGGGTLFFQRVRGAAVGLPSFWGFSQKAVSKDIVAGAGSLWVPEDQESALRKALERNGIQVTDSFTWEGAPGRVRLSIWYLGPSLEAGEAFKPLWRAP